MTGASTQFLPIYLRDQLALGVLWRELAQRSARHNRGSDLGRALDGVATGIAEDVDTFTDIMRRLDVAPNRLKTGAAVVAERLGRLKLNGRLWGYSPLSRFLELDALVMGIEGKKTLWTTLGTDAGLGARFPDVDFDQLVRRAGAQREALDPFHDAVAAEVFRSRASPAFTDGAEARVG